MQTVNAKKKAYFNKRCSNDFSTLEPEKSPSLTTVAYSLIVSSRASSRYLSLLSGNRRSRPECTAGMRVTHPATPKTRPLMSNPLALFPLLEGVAVALLAKVDTTFAMVGAIVREGSVEKTLQRYKGRCREAGTWLPGTRCANSASCLSR